MDHLRDIDRLEAVRAVTEPHRWEIIQLLLAGPHTLTSLGQVMDKHPAWIRHHVKALETVGLVHLAEERTTRNYTEKFYRASAAAFRISLLVRPEETMTPPLVALVSNDRAVELLAEQDDGTLFTPAITGSLDALIGLRQGIADIAGCHLLDTETGEYNIPFVHYLFPERDLTVVTLAHRAQGLVVAPGNPLALRSLADVAQTGARFANRNRSSGTRLWIDQALRADKIDAASIVGYDTIADTHCAAAEAVAQGRADAAVAIAAAAEQFGLEFVPLFKERYDFVMADETYDTPEVARLLSRLRDPGFQSAVAAITGYDSAHTGEEYRVGR